MEPMFESQGASTDGVGLYGYSPGLSGKWLPIAACWQVFFNFMMTAGGILFNQ